jgi:tetratricopeptide (TPR) repeat protein
MIDRGSYRLGHHRLWLLLPAMIVVFSAVTYMRAEQWSSFPSLFNYEVKHNPNSATTHSGMGVVLMEQGKYDEAMREFRRAAELKPEEASYLLIMHMFSARAGVRLAEEDYRETTRRLTEGHITATTGQALQYVGDCILTWCRSLDRPFETWLHILIDRANMDVSYYYYLLGRTLFSQEKFVEAVQAYQYSHDQDRNYLHPLIELAYVYLRLGEAELAEETLEKLRAANRLALHPRTPEIQKLQKDVDEMKQRRQNSPPKQQPRPQ